PLFVTVTRRQRADSGDSSAVVKRACVQAAAEKIVVWMETALRDPVLAREQAKFQGMWRVVRVVNPVEAPKPGNYRLTFVGDELRFLPDDGRQIVAPVHFRIDPTKEPRQFDMLAIDDVSDEAMRALGFLKDSAGSAATPTPPTAPTPPSSTPELSIRSP